MRVTLTLSGAEDLARDLRGVALAVDRPRRPLLSILGEDMASTFQDFIRTGGQRLPTPWPALHPVTVKIRDYYGHGGPGPKLIRGGQFLHSLRVLSVTDEYVEVGSSDPRARILQDGGEWTDPETGATRHVQAFPYIHLLEEDVDAWMEMVAEWFFSRGGSGSGVLRA